MNTDAEGRLVMADALVLAVEDGSTPSLTSRRSPARACGRSGTEVAGVHGQRPPASSSR